MNMPAEIAKAARRWVEKAESDFAAITQLLKAGKDCPCDVVCYHAQQCVEKYVKALLVHAGVDFPKTHDIGNLVRLLPRGVRLPISRAEQIKLTLYEAATRYPGDEEQFGFVDANQSKKIVERVRKAIRGKLLKGVI